MPRKLRIQYPGAMYHVMSVMSREGVTHQGACQQAKEFSFPNFFLRVDYCC